MLFLQAEGSAGVDAVILGEDKYEMMLAIKELAYRGMAAEVVEEINAIDPSFFTQLPDLLFQLKQVGCSDAFLYAGKKKKGSPRTYSLFRCLMEWCNLTLLFCRLNF